MTSTQTWQQKLKCQQLLKKRSADRAYQQESRKKRKNTIVELEACLQQLINEGDASLIRETMNENDRLRAKLARFQAKVENLNLAALRFLEEEEQPLDASGVSEMDDLADLQYLIEPRLPPSVLPKCLWHSYRSSIFFLACIESNMRDKIESAHDVENVLLESLLIWKSEHGYAETSCKLVRVWLDQPYAVPAVNQGELDRFVRCKDLFRYICNDIEGRDPFPASPSESQLDLNIVEWQQRSIAFYAFKTLSAWKKYFTSSHVYLAHFWAQYRYLLFLTMPTNKNWRELPPWQRPVKSQLLQNHPWSIDAMVWPYLRESLVWTWQQYDEKQIEIEVVKHVSFTATIPAETAIQATDDGLDFILDPIFKEAMFDISSFTLDQSVFKQYPELLTSKDVMPGVSCNTAASLPSPDITVEMLGEVASPTCASRQKPMSLGDGERPEKIGLTPARPSEEILPGCGMGDTFVQMDFNSSEAYSFLYDDILNMPSLHTSYA